MHGLVPVVHSAGPGAVDPHPGCAICARLTSERHRSTRLQDWVWAQILAWGMNAHWEAAHRVMR
ncbi:hypothetical protein [Streptomyces sp. UNOC14_S4]|uniref:hypothetical protein n=1 Tax=Streptomyces sp. UNOC14_S4 TaxID=2872340 RepID=UPI001E3B2558|nr:hypothetical protein [Streptomyces sp. UNOC14_S4]MCC3766881.1 hypothetical protein [Streptomyces sp. UNOC14_S4]